ncbi:MAG: Ig-like domain-containing protein, partial [Blastocatellia bacterium]
TPATMVRVAADIAPFIDITGATGSYLILGAAGPGVPASSGQTNLLSASSVVTDATGSASATLSSQDSIATVPITVASVPLSVLSVSPQDASTGVIVTTQVEVTFSKPIAPSTLTGSSFTVSTAAGNPVNGHITLLAGNRVGVFAPSSTLSNGTTYNVALTTGVQDLYGNAIGGAFQSSFTTAASVPVNNQLQPSQIQVTYPDSQSFSTVTIPAFSVPAGSTIIVINNTTGATITAVSGSGALILKIQAKVGDEIIVQVNQPDGTQYQVSQGAYIRSDGFTSVSFNGGAVTSGDGSISLTVPKGGISGQADIMLSPLAETDIQIPRQGQMDPTKVPFGGGARIQTQGTFTYQQDLHLELTAPATATDGQRVEFMTPNTIQSGGSTFNIWQVVTSGRVDGGKFKTSSPPFEGLAGLAFGILDVYVFMPIQGRAVFGTVTDPAKVPVPNVLVLVGTAATTNAIGSNIAARSDKNGIYSTFDNEVQDPASVPVLGIDDTNNRRAGAVANTATDIE